jgi:hypothetical protein
MKLRPPHFDIWFWLLAIWSLISPWLFDGAHIDSCRERGLAAFMTVPWETSPVFECKPLKERE